MGQSNTGQVRFTAGDEVSKLDTPIDVMLLIHKALSAEAARVQGVIERFEPGGSLQSFKVAFTSWAAMLMFHADMEDKYMTAPLTSFQPARDNETEHQELAHLLGGLNTLLDRGDIKGLEECVRAALIALHDAQHAELMEKLEDVLAVLNGEIGRTRVIPRTKRHLYRKVVELRICQDDHFESEEAFVLPEVRSRMRESQQVEVARRLLVDEEAEAPRWFLDWVARGVTPGERRLLAKFEAQFRLAGTATAQPRQELDLAADR